MGNSERLDIEMNVGVRSDQGPGVSVAVVVPCFNEEDAIEDTLRDLVSVMKGGREFEIVVVNDGSTDNTGRVLQSASERWRQVRLVEHESNRGYGAALKTGIRAARAALIAIIDSDGTYPITDIPRLVDLMETADMVVGARTGAIVEYPWIRKVPKVILSRYMEWIAGQRIPDMNSGLRVFRREDALNLIRILPNGFSFTTTITLAMMTDGMTVRFVPINYQSRIGRSKIHPIRDTLQFMQLIVRTGMYFAPLKVLSPLIGGGFLLTLAAFVYDIGCLGNLTDKSVVLLTFSLNIMVFALLADMVDKRSPR